MKRLFSLAGLIGGILWIGIAFYPPQCIQVPEEYEILCNRLWTPGLLGMMLGSIGLYISTLPVLAIRTRLFLRILMAGFSLMFLGNFLEYWIFYALPHEGPNGFVRGLLWMTFLLGLLLVLVASFLAGFFGYKSGGLPRWLTMVLIFLLPATLVIGFTGPHWIGIPLGMLAIVAGACGISNNNNEVQEISSI